MLVLISALATNEIVIQSSDSLRVLNETAGLDIWGFISTIVATGIGAWLGVILTLKLNYKLEQKKLKLNMIDQMYLKIRPKMVDVTKNIQTFKCSIRGERNEEIKESKGPIEDLRFSNCQEEIEHVLNVVDDLVSEIYKYRLAKLILDDYIEELKINADYLGEYLDVTNINLKELIECLEEINRTVLRSEEYLNNYYLQEIGLYKSKEWKKYNNKIKRDIEVNRELIRNSEVPFGVMIDQMERNHELD